VRKKWFAVVVFLTYVLLVLLLTLRHEAWADEADSWLIARDSTLGEMFKLLAHGGTPSLWYFVQMPFAKFGFFFVTQGFLNLMIVIIGVGIFFLVYFFFL